MIALDLFAGTGWGVACQRLGIHEVGIEMMPEAVATREAAGMTTLLRDVWSGIGKPTDPSWGYDMLIASPPCQTFSMAGSGTGRKALDEVLALIEEEAYLDPTLLRAFGKRHDPRTALVLTPLTYVARDMPRVVVLEQVPPVLPVWEAMANELRRNGYSAVTGILNAEQYGVPQTRKRAVLIARRDGIKATMPTPTHSAYWPRDADRLDGDVLPWTSMADALGWGMTRRPYVSVATGTEAGGTDPMALGGSGARRLVMNERDAGRWDWGRIDLPAPTLAGDERLPKRGYRTGTERQMDGALRLTASEAAVLQSYPADFPFQGGKGKVFQQIGNAVPPLLAEAILRPLVDASR